METGAKHFKKRQAILDCLRMAHTHPTAEWVYARLKEEYPDLSLGTVYRNLAMFKKQGIITSLGTVGGTERFDADTCPHVHFICTRCGSVTDLPQMEVPASLSGAASRYSGGDVTACQLSFSGLCRRCVAQKSVESRE